MARPGIRQLAAFTSLVTLLVSAVPAAGSAAGLELYRRLRMMGFRPSCVLAARRVLSAGLEPHLPPDFIDDAVAEVLGAAGSPTPPPASGGELARRRSALQALFLCMHDTAATDINRLVAACRCAPSVPPSHTATGLLVWLAARPRREDNEQHPVSDRIVLYMADMQTPEHGKPSCGACMYCWQFAMPCTTRTAGIITTGHSGNGYRDNHLWEGLIHAAELIHQPLLPAHDMLAAAATGFAAAPCRTPDSGTFLLHYARACLLRAPAGSGRPQQDAHSSQMCMLAFLLWTTSEYFRQVAPPAVSDLLQVRHRPLPAVLQTVGPRPALPLSGALSAARVMQPHLSSMQLPWSPAAVFDTRPPLCAMQDPYPALQLLLRIDAAATVAMFEDLPLLEEGAYCGTDDVAAAIAPLGLPELHCLAPRPVLALRQAVVNAFARLVSLDSLAAAAEAPAAGCATGSEASSPAQLIDAPLRLVCRQVGRSPPAVLAPAFAAACIRRLCAGGRPVQSMVEAVASAVDLEPSGAAPARPAGTALAPALQALESAELWGPAALLYSRLGDLAGEIRCSLVHCQEVCDACCTALLYACCLTMVELRSSSACVLRTDACTPAWPIVLGWCLQVKSCLS